MVAALAVQALIRQYRSLIADLRVQLEEAQSAGGGEGGEVAQLIKEKAQLQDKVGCSAVY